MAMRGEAQTSSEDPYSFQDLPAADPGSLLGQSAKQVMKEVIEYSRKVTEFLSNEIKSESRFIAVEQLQQASRKLDTFAEALREAAGKLREKQSYSLADVFENCSESVMRLSNNLRASNPDRIIGEMEDFARINREYSWALLWLQESFSGSYSRLPEGARATFRKFIPGRSHQSNTSRERMKRSTMKDTERDRASDQGVSSLGDILRDLSKSGLDLIQGEVRLAASEMSQKVSRAGKNAQLVTIGASVTYAGFLLILAAAVIALSVIIPAGWAALVVGVTVLLAGVMTMLIGKKRLRDEDFIPRETIDTLKEDTKWMRDQLK